MTKVRGDLAAQWYAAFKPEFVAPEARVRDLVAGMTPDLVHQCFDRFMEQLRDQKP